MSGLRFNISGEFNYSVSKENDVRSFKYSMHSGNGFLTDCSISENESLHSKLAQLSIQVNYKQAYLKVMEPSRTALFNSFRLFSPYPRLSVM